MLLVVHAGFIVSTLVLKIREGCEDPYVEIHVDAEDLGARVKAALGEAGFEDVLPWYGGDYTIDDTVLGGPVRRCGGEGAILFACGCGQFACGAVFANVVVDGDTLTLREIYAWRGGARVVAALPPVVFNRGQFEDAVRGLERDVAMWRPPAKDGG
jgi:hypothetical protein